MLKALEKAGGNVSRAARLLGLSRRTLQYRMGKMQGCPKWCTRCPKRCWNLLRSALPTH